MRKVPGRSMLGLLLTVVGVLGMLLVGLNPPEPVPVAPVVDEDARVELKMLAGSELRDLLDPEDAADPEFRRRLERETGVSLKVEFTGSLSGAEKIAASPKAYELAWFASSSYLDVLRKSYVQDREPVMESPVALGVRPEVAAEYGWDQEAPTWKEIAAKTQPDPQTGEGFAFAMTDPAMSNSGLSALAAAATAFNHGEPLSTAAIDAVGPRLTSLFRGNGATGGLQRISDSSGYLADQFPALIDVDALFNYESELLTLEQDSGVVELVYPSDGVAMADYPLMLLNEVSSEQKEAYGRLTGWLMDSWAQTRIVQDTRRRSVAFPGLNQDFPEIAEEVAIPASKTELDDLILTYQNESRKPPSTLYVIDTSGSMGNEEIEGLTQTRMQALSNVFRELSGGDARSAVPQFRRFRNREQVWILPFNSELPGQVAADGTLRSRRDLILATITGPPGSAAQQELMARVDAIEPTGSTALYDALYEGFYRLAELGRQEAPDGNWETYSGRHYSTIVLLTDGVTGKGMNLRHFEELWKKLPNRDVPVYVVAIGQGPVATTCENLKDPIQQSEEPLCRLAARTGGRVFDTSTESLLDVMREIRGNQ
ncbi:vWA domain-containing protein [Kineosporia babensis]|uniref:Substrate-binding domain-containing protein n=1 Tax=Kineosporia babensis TaxID=499548 RepID=A0A9X1NCL3_9ACTN|nr:substrate-binding domain-containing protein [Kineosporia babensis]MCD5311235.1 substrate-binding domain-containing protein [Kineosporia babensis]